MKHPTISSHFSNDDDRHYRFARRADPPWYPESSKWTPDHLVFIVCLMVIVAIVLGLSAGLL